MLYCWIFLRDYETFRLSLMDGSGIESDADTWALIYVKHVSKHSSSVVDPER